MGTDWEVDARFVRAISSPSTSTVKSGLEAESVRTPLLLRLAKDHLPGIAPIEGRKDRISLVSFPSPQLTDNLLTPPLSVLYLNIVQSHMTGQLFNCVNVIVEFSSVFLWDRKLYAEFLVNDNISVNNECSGCHFSQLADGYSGVKLLPVSPRVRRPTADACDPISLVMYER